MPYLLDTGILLRLFDRTYPGHLVVRDSIRILKASENALYTTHQNIAEFWNVSTRPCSARGGYGLPTAVVSLRVAFIERLCRLLASDVSAYREWKRLVEIHGVSGVAVHDAR